MLPEPGGIFVPSHLRVLHNSTEPLFFLGSLYENLTFGLTPGDPDGDFKHVLNISEKLAIGDKVMNRLKQEELGHADVRAWNDVLSHTERSLCCLARAMVTNPEVFVCHKPTMAYDDTTSHRVLSILREFCWNKGLDQDEAKRHVRRPRTCIITSSKMLGVVTSDCVYHVSKARGIRLLSKEEVTTDMLG